MQIDCFGAENCFRQAIMNDSFDIDEISKFAIAGGSNEIVRIPELIMDERIKRKKEIQLDNVYKYLTDMVQLKPEISNVHRSNKQYSYFAIRCDFY